METNSQKYKYSWTKNPVIIFLFAIEIAFQWFLFKENRSKFTFYLRGVANYRKRAGVFVLEDSKIIQDIKHVWPNITWRITSYKTYVQIIQFTHLGSFKEILCGFKRSLSPVSQRNLLISTSSQLRPHPCFFNLQLITSAGLSFSPLPWIVQKKFHGQFWKKLD